MKQTKQQTNKGYVTYTKWRIRQLHRWQLLKSHWSVQSHTSAQSLPLKQIRPCTGAVCQLGILGKVNLFAYSKNGTHVFLNVADDPFSVQ